MPRNEINEKVRAIKEITSEFRLERIVYLSGTAICLVLLLVTVILALIRREMGSPEVVGLFGSGGGFVVMTGRLLHMWNRAMNLLDQREEAKE